MNKVKEMTERAIQENRLIDLLIGKGDWYVPYSEFIPSYMVTNHSEILSGGIYSVYRTDEKIKQLFEDSLLQMSKIDAFHYYVAICYIYGIIFSEKRGLSSFNVSPKLLREIGGRFWQHEQELKCGVRDTRGYCHKKALEEILQWNKMIKEKYRITLIEGI